MKISKNDLCDSCRNLEIVPGQTFGEFIDKVMEVRGGVFSDQNDYGLVCHTLTVNLGGKGGCAKCIEHFRKIAEQYSPYK